MKYVMFIELIGEYETGKTHLASTFPNPVLLDTTPARNFGGLKVGESMLVFSKLHKDWKERYFLVSSFEDVDKAINKAIEDNRVTVIIDNSADLVVRMGEEWYLKVENTPEKMRKRKAQGKPEKKEKVYPITEWSKIYNYIDVNIFQKIMSNGMHLVCISKLKDEYILDKKTGRRVRDGYKKLDFMSDLRILMKLEKKGGKWIRRGIVRKNRFADRTSSWVEELSELNFKGILDLIEKTSGISKNMWRCE